MLFFCFLNDSFLARKYSDAIGLDVTYTVCKEGVSLLLFVGVNSYGKSFILMGCFISREDAETFKFSLRCFVSMGFKQPTVCITDQDRALISAINEEWKETTHLFCIFHIYRNVQKNIAHFLKHKNTAFLKDFSQVQRKETIEEFEDGWKLLMQDYCKDNVRDNVRSMDIVDSHSSSSSDEENMSETFSESSEEPDQESQRELKVDSNNEALKNYLDSLYKNKTSWARCFTFRHFAAGFSILPLFTAVIIFFLLFLPLTLIILSEKV